MCRAGPADNLALFAALEAAKPGDIVVAASDASSTTAITGDLLLGMALNRGIRGLVTDGLVRDLVGILAVGLPVYCRGLTPNSPDRNGPASVGLPVIIGGVQVESCDVVVADADGVVIVPRGKLAMTIKALDDVRAAEAALDAKVKAGLEIPDFVRAVLASDRVVEVS